MESDRAVSKAAKLFKVLGSTSRLRLMGEIRREPATVTALVEATGMSQPLVSQHLRMLREAELVKSIRRGREMLYEVADTHVLHMISDALEHVSEDEVAAASGPDGACAGEAAVEHRAEQGDNLAGDHPVG